MPVFPSAPCKVREVALGCRLKVTLLRVLPSTCITVHACRGLQSLIDIDDEINFVAIHASSFGRLIHTAAGRSCIVADEIPLQICKLYAMAIPNTPQ